MASTIIKKINHLLERGLIALIRVYRYFFSLLLGQCCRFQPSCSTYAMEAITMHGCFKGCYFAMRRLLRCHPWCDGGIDPIPQRKRSIP